MDPLLIKDTFVLICEYFDLKTILKFESLSKLHKQFIRIHTWKHFSVKINNMKNGVLIDDWNFVCYITTTYNFRNIDLSNYCTNE